MAINPDEYFASKLVGIDINQKMADVAEASRNKASELSLMKFDAERQAAEDAQARVASQNSWVGKMALDPNSLEGGALNLGASLASGATRVVGHIASIPTNFAAVADEGKATDADIAAYNRYQEMGDLSGPETMQQLARKPFMAGPNDSPEQTARMQAEVNANPNAPTIKDVLDRAGRMRYTSRKINNFFDTTSIVEQGKRKELAADLGDDFQSSWDEVKKGWGEGKEGNVIGGSGNVIAGVARLLYNAGEAAITNPGAASEYIVENVPQLALGAAGRIGVSALSASNLGYAADQYSQGIENYKRANDQKLPSNEERREMAFYAASLALAEQVGDLSLLKQMKVLGGVDDAAQAGKTGFIQGVKNTAAATGKGAATEGATEGYQTYVENVLTKYDATGANKLDPTAKEVYTGGVIGAIAGGGLSGGGRAVSEIAGATPAHEANRTADRDAFREAAQANDASIFLNPTSPKYDPSKAVGVLLSHAQMPDTTPEVKAANLKQAGEILSKLEEQHAVAQESAEARSPESVQYAKDQLKSIKDQIKNTDPADTARVEQLSAIAEVMGEELADIGDSKQAMKANTELSRLTRQLQASRELISGLNTVAAPQLDTAGLDALVAEVSTDTTSAAANRLINLSMTQPDMLSSEAATSLASDMTNTLSKEQRAHLRAFSAARIAENSLSTTSKVSQEIMAGSSKNVGIAEYQSRIAAAIASGSELVANRQLKQLSNFAKDHADKTRKVLKALQNREATQVVRVGKEWVIVTDPKQFLDAKKLKANGGLDVHPVKTKNLADEMIKEVRALKMAEAEMKSATSLKFGVQSNSSEKQVSSEISNSPKNEEDTARPVVPTEPLPVEPTPTPKDVHTGKKLDDRASADNYIRDNKLRATHRVDQTGRSEYTIKSKTAVKSNWQEKAAAKEAAEKAIAIKQQAKEEEKSVTKKAAAEQQASVSEANSAPVAEAALSEAQISSSEFASNKTKGTLSLFEKATAKGTEVAYKARNLIADYFVQDKGTDGTLRPLAAVKDFLTTYKADPSSVQQHLQTKMTEAQIAVVNAFMASATAWSPKIKDSLVRIGNADFRYKDMVQFFITEDGAVDMDENVKTAISYAAFEAMIDLYSAGRINNDAAINGILGKNPDALVDPAARTLLAEAGTLEKALKNGWGQAAVAALGLKTNSNAPVNLMPALEAAMGAHVHKLLMELGVVERVEVSRTQMNEFSSESKRGETTAKDDFVKVQFSRLVRDAEGNVKPLVQKIFDTNKGTQSVLSKLFAVESFFIEPTTKPVEFDQAKAGDGKMNVPSKLEAVVSRANKAENKLNAELFNFVLGQVSPEIAMQMAGEEEVTENMHKSRRIGTQAKNDGLRREYDRLMEFVKGTLGDKLDQSIFFQHDVWVQQRVGIKTNMVNPQTSKLQRHMLYQPSWEAQVNVNDPVAMENFLLRVAEGLGVKTDKMSREAALDKVRALLQKQEIKGAINVLNKARSMTGLSENDQAILAAGVKAGSENFHSLSVLMAMANYAQARKDGATEFTTQLMAEVDGVTNGPMLSHLLMGAASSVAGLFNLLNRGGFYQQGSNAEQYNVWRSVAGHMDLYEQTTRNVLNNVKLLLLNGKVDSRDLAAVFHFTGTLEDANGAVDKAGRNIIKTPLTAMVFGSSVASAVDSMADKFVEGAYAKIEGLVAKPEDKATLIKNLNALGVNWSAGMTVQEMLDTDFTNKQVKVLKGALKDTLGKAVAETMKQDFEQFLDQRTQFNLTAQLTFDIYNAAYKAERQNLIDELVAAGEIAVDGKGKPIHDLTKAQEKTVRDRIKSLAPVMHSAMSKDSGEIDAGLFMGKTERTFSEDSTFQNEVHFGTEVKGTGAKSSNVAGYETTGINPGVAMAPLSVHAFDSMISHYAAKQGDVLNIHDAHGAGLDQIKDAARNLNHAVWNAALNYSPAQEMTDALLRTVHGLADTYKGKIPADVLSNLASVVIDMAQKQEANSVGFLLVSAARAKDMAFRADSMKLQAMEEMGHIDQYAMEGGNYLVTPEDRIAAASLRSALASGLSVRDQKVLESVENQLDKAIKAELAKRDGKVVPADPEMDPAQVPTPSVAELGKPVIQSDKTLVDAFKQAPVMTLKQAVALLRGSLKSDFSLKLLSALDRATASDITIRYVTPTTIPAELLEQGGDKARGWYVSKDGVHEIYVLSPEFKHSGLTAELLLHELTHAALARTIEQAQVEGKGAAYELVQELASLITKAESYAKVNNLLDKFAPALVSVHEFVSWGMTNVEFQNDVLNHIEYKSSTTENKLVAGMKAFINVLTTMIFGKPNVNMANGMSVMIQNVSGLFLEAANNKNKIKAAPIVLNQVNNGPTVRDLSTTDIYDALAQNNNGATVSSAFDAKLKDLLAGIVNRLHGPFGSFKESVMAQTIVEPDAVFAEAMVTGIAPMAFSALAAGFAWTEQEAFVGEQVHATMIEAMENKTGITSVAYRELAKLYAEVRSKVTPADFATGTTAAEVAEGQRLYNFIFEVKQGADGRSDYLARFVAMGMTHEGFNTILQMATSRNNRDTTGMSFNERLNKIFETIMNWFTGKMTNTVDGQSADAKLTSLVTQLVRIEERKRAVLKLKTNVLSPIESVSEALGQAARNKLEAFGKLPFFQNSTSGFTRLAGSLTSAYAGDRFDAIAEGFNRMRDQHFRTQQGIAASLVNEFRGSNASNMVFHFLLRASKHLEGMRKNLITHTGSVVLGSFANNGLDLNEHQKSAISAVFLRTDMSSLTDHYSISQLSDLVNDKQKVLDEIKKFEAKLTGKYRLFYLNSAKVLAYYKAIGKVTDAHMLMNASNVAKLYGTAYQNKVTVSEATAAAAIIDPLVSLYALSYSTDTHMRNARKVFAAEQARTDGGNGVDMLLRTHKDLQAKSKEQLFNGSEALQMKGYTVEIYDPYMAVVVADEQEGKTLMLQGYTQGDLVGVDMADPNSVAKHIYYLRDGGLKHQLTGVFSYTGMRSKGSRLHNGNRSALSFTGQQNLADMASIQSKKNKAVTAMFTNRAFDPTKVQDTFMAPVLNANGDVVNYRYLMSENVKDKLLMRDNRPDKVLGTMAGSILDKVDSVGQNRRAVSALKEQYNQEFAEMPESYMTVGPKSTDPQLREIWAMLPESTKQAVKEIWGSEQMKVRVDLLDINFGYRKLSVADAFQKEEAERNFVEQMFVTIMTYAFDEKAGLRIRQAEDIWQAVVKATKANLVVKSWSTMSGNLRSNWSQLLLMGVSPAKILSHHRVAFKGAWAYKKDSEELFGLQHQIDTGYLQPGQTVTDIKHQIARLEDALARNPVKPLIDAGLMPTIVEDVQADDELYSYKSRFNKKVDEWTSGVNKNVMNVGKEVLMLEGSRAYRTMSYATQISDFLARYTLYQVKTDKGMSKEDAIQLASDAFINYDVPTHRMVQYANDSGLVMFTKYYIRIQKMIARIYRDSPGRAFTLIAAEAMIGAQPTVLDSSMITRWGNPMNLGALDYPGSLSALTTVRILSSPFSSGGNPAE